MGDIKGTVLKHLGAYKGQEGFVGFPFPLFKSTVGWQNGNCNGKNDQIAN